MSAEDFNSDAEALVKTLQGEAHTLVRSPSSTVFPPQDGSIGKRALEVLKGLLFDPKALVDEGPLGEGGMGVVRVAKQVALDRHVAVKFLRPEHREANDVEALLSEAWRAGALDHPNILPVYSVSLDGEGQPVIVMKRIEGKTWTTLLRDPSAMAAHAPGKAALDEHLRILMQVCNAVHFAHSRGVVHRDLKPDNVMVGSFGEVYVVDWGIATAPGPSLQLAGTPASMAPEMLGGPSAVISERTDVYLLGSILYEVLAGRPPHRGDTPNSLVQMVLRSSPPIPDGAPEELIELLRKCLKPKPEDRLGSALEVRRALEAFVEHQGSLTLATQSERKAEELKTLLATASPDATRVYGLFSECRFGFQQALNAWPRNTRARAGLEGALKAMARFELSHGSVKAARALVSELGSPDPALEAALEAAAKREAEKVAELERLQVLEQSMDPLKGSSARVLITTVVGAIWVIFPLFGPLQDRLLPGSEMIAAAPPALLSALVMVVVGWRNRTARTQLNRQLLSIIVFGMLVQVAFILFFFMSGGDLGPLSVAVFAGFWFVISGIVTVSILPSLWPIPLGYLTGSVGGYLWPQHRYLFASFANLVLVVTSLVLFRRERREALARDTHK